MTSGQSDIIGKTISHYRVLTKVGEGGMGVVYKALDTKLQRAVALKFLRSTALSDLNRRARFVREAQSAAALDHPNICTVYGIEEKKGQIFISMAFAEGTNLKERVASGPLPIDEAIHIATQIAQGLEAAHQRGIIHRDIKSSNVMVTDRRHARIMDFGLATSAEGTEITRTDKVMGTPAYMAPEQIRGEFVDQRTDIWAWGVVLYEMLTGELPFSGETSAELIYAILNRLPEAASQLNPDVSGDLDHLLDRALAKDPEDRFQGMQELLAVLRRPSDAPLFDTSSQHMKRAASLPSIGVLPFADMSAENDQEYFCDGIAEEIINNLTHVEGVRVAARTSAFSFKDTPVSIQEIGRKLRVETILEGSVRKFKNRIRITSQLINVTDGFHLWSESYDRELEDIFSIQEEIANRIVQALRVQLTEREKKALQKAATLNVRAYDFYLRGRQYFYQSNKHGVEYAVRMFKKAIGQDPDYAMAYAGLADCHSYLFMYYDASQANLESAKKSSGKALELDPELAEAHAARGLAVGLTQEWEEAEKQFERAIDLNPNLFEAHYFYARIRFAQGQLAEAAKLFERASRVNPDDYQAASLQACALKSMERHEEAEKAYSRNLKRIRRRLELNPDDSRALYLGSHALLETGEKQQAVEWAERAYALGPDDPYTVYGLACFYAQIGNIKRSLDTLEKAIEVGFAHKAWILNDGDLDPIRDHRRFKSLLDSLPGGDKAAGSGK